MTTPSHWFVEPDGSTIVTVGHPNDGLDYRAIEPMTDTNGQRVVWFHTGHEWGYAVSDPKPGAHLPKVQTRGWSLGKLATYWIYAVPDDAMPRHLVGDEVRVLVPIHHAWLVPQPPPVVSA